MRTRFTVPDYSCHIWLRLCFGTLYQLVSTYSLYKILGRFVRFDFISSFFPTDIWLFSRWHVIECWLCWGSSLPLDLSGPALQDAAVLQCCRSWPGADRGHNDSRQHHSTTRPPMPRQCSHQPQHCRIHWGKQCNFIPAREIIIYKLNISTYLPPLTCPFCDPKHLQTRSMPGSLFAYKKLELKYANVDTGLKRILGMFLPAALGWPPRLDQAVMNKTINFLPAASCSPALETDNPR